MKAARLVERRKPLELTDLPDPAPGPGEVVVEVEAEGICRTDWSCGRCGYCRAGRSNLCDDMQFLGLTHDGGYARYATIRNADFNCIALPDSIEALSAAAIGCRHMTAFHAVTRQGGLTAGQWVAVHGAGGVGLSAVQIAAALGFSVITEF